MKTKEKKIYRQMQLENVLLCILDSNWNLES